MYATAAGGLEGKGDDMAITFKDVQAILENAVNGDEIGKHGNFWRTTLVIRRV
jgi:hypothetical protein